MIFSTTILIKFSFQIHNGTHLYNIGCFRQNVQNPSDVSALMGVRLNPLHTSAIDLQKQSKKLWMYNILKSLGMTDDSKQVIK